MELSLLYCRFSAGKGKQWNTIYNVCLDHLSSPDIWGSIDKKIPVKRFNSKFKCYLFQYFQRVNVTENTMPILGMSGASMVSTHDQDKAEKGKQ